MGSSCLLARLHLCHKARGDWCSRWALLCVPADLHHLHRKDNLSRKLRVTVKLFLSLQFGKMFEFEKAYPTFKSMTKPVIITTRDFVEHKVNFVLSVFSQMAKAIEIIFLRNIIHDSHAQLQLWYSPTTPTSVSHFLISGSISNTYFETCCNFKFLLTKLVLLMKQQLPTLQIFRTQVIYYDQDILLIIFHIMNVSHQKIRQIKSRILHVLQIPVCINRVSVSQTSIFPEAQHYLKVMRNVCRHQTGTQVGFRIKKVYRDKK